MIPYRVKQVKNFLRREPSDEDIAWIMARLTPPQQALFFAQQAGDQAHAVSVARALHAQGYHDERLLCAALLHDAGKAPGVRLVYRVGVVLLKKLAPATLRRLPPETTGPLEPLARALHHPELGAKLAKSAGCHPDVVTLIANHQLRDATLEPPLKDLLAALQAVDDRS